MKTKYNDFFTESVIEEIANKITKLTVKATAELGFGNIEEDSEEEIDLSKEQLHKIVEFVINKQILTKEKNIKDLWTAINGIDLTTINELKNNIKGEEYAETLITSLLLNSGLRNDKVIQFLLTETEISECPTLKAKVIYEFLDVESESELNEEIIELLRIDNEAAFREELTEVLWNSNVPDELFIKSFDNVLDINKPLIREGSYEEYSLTREAMFSNRPKLVQYLINKGAKILPNEAGFLLQNTNISDQLFINSFESISDVNKCTISGSSLIVSAIRFNHPELLRHLINIGVKISINEVEPFFNNIRASEKPLVSYFEIISDKPLISYFESISDADINKSLIKKVSHDQGQTFHDEEYSLLMRVINSDRQELMQYLINRGAKILFNEVEHTLRNTKISDQLLISSLESTSDINKLNNEASLLFMKTMQSHHNRPELIQYLIDKGAKILLDEVKHILWNRNISDQFLINCLKNIPDINKPIIKKVTNYQDQTTRDEEYSLLSDVIWHKRWELVQYLLDKGVKISLNEIESYLRNHNISDQFLINCLKNIPDINKPIIKKVTNYQDQTTRDEEYSLLLEVIENKRLELAQYLVDKGAKISADEVHSLLWNDKVSDQLLISSIDISDINKPLIKKVTNYEDQTTRDEEYSLLSEVIENKRLELAQYLVDRGADVNFEDSKGKKLYVTAYRQGIEFFEALVSSGRLLKDSNMDNYNVNLDSQTSLSLSEVYNVIMWRNDFNASLSRNFQKLDKWFSDGKVHSIKSLLNAYQKFSNIKIDHLADCSKAFKQAQDKYGKEVISQKKNEIDDALLKIKKYFSKNWEKSLLICKNFSTDTLFGIDDLKVCIGNKLFDSFIADMTKEEVAQEVDLGGEAA